jgi:hypothetical protein
MASAGTVTLDLDANSVKMIRELLKAQRQTRRTATSMQRDMSASFSKIAKRASIAAGAIQAALALVVRSQARAIDDLGKTADALGVSTQSLQALQFAAQLTGTSADQLSTNMERMQRRLGEVARGGGTAAKALREIGINIKDIQNLSADEQMEVLARALANVENAAVRASIANDLFGRDGVRMLKLMDLLARDGIGGFRDELKALGVDISREGAAKVEMMNDAMLKLSMVGKGAGQTLTMELAPVIAEIAKELTKAAKESGGFRDHIIEGMDKAVIAVGVFADGLRGLQDLYQGLTFGAAEFAATFVRGLAKIDSALAEIDGSNALADKILGPDDSGLGTFLEEIATSLENVAADIGDKFKAGLDRELPSDVIAKRFAEIKANADRAARSDSGEVMQLSPIVLSDEVLAHHKRITDEMRRDASMMWERGRTDAEKYTAAVHRALDLLNRGLIDQDAFDRYVANLAEAMDKTKEPFDQMSEFGKQAARSIQSAFANFLFDPFSGGLKGMLQGFSETLRRMAAEIVANKLLTSFLGRLAGSSNSFFSSIGESFTPRAMGGPVSAGGNYLVGERGPELFFPGVSGMIMPNHAIAGGAQIINNITVQAPEGRISRQSELQLRQSLASATNEGLRRAG